MCDPVLIVCPQRGGSRSFLATCDGASMRHACLRRFLSSTTNPSGTGAFDVGRVAVIRDTELVTLLQTLIAAGQGQFSTRPARRSGCRASTVSRRVKSLETPDRHQAVRPPPPRHPPDGGRRRLSRADRAHFGRAQYRAAQCLDQGARTDRLAQDRRLRLTVDRAVADRIARIQHRFPDVDVQYTDGERRVI